MNFRWRANENAELNLFYLINFSFSSFFQFTKSVYLFFTWALDFLFRSNIYRQNSVIIFTKEQYFHSTNMVAPIIHFVIMQCLQQQQTYILSLRHKILLLTSLFLCIRSVQLCLFIGERISMTWSRATLFLMIWRLFCTCTVQRIKRKDVIYFLL